MKTLLLIVCLALCLNTFSQNRYEFLSVDLSANSYSNLNYYSNNFDSVLDLARKQQKDVLLIIASNQCQNHFRFKREVISDNAITEFLNNEFIVFIYYNNNRDSNLTHRLRRYNKSWPGWPQLYFLDYNENLITDIIYPLQFPKDEYFEIIRNYRDIELNWRNIRRTTRKPRFKLEDLQTYIMYRQLKYSSFDYILINRKVSKFLRSLRTEELTNIEYWTLFDNYVNLYELGSDKELFDYVLVNRKLFEQVVGIQSVSDYLERNFTIITRHKSARQINRMSRRYPYNSVPEAISAIELYWKNKLTIE